MLALILANIMQPVPITFDVIVTSALADAKLQPAATVPYVRYLCASNESGEGLERLYAVTNYQLNSLSREPQIVKARKVNEWLWAIDTRDYGEPFVVAWEAFANDNPYFVIKVEPVKQKQVIRYDMRGTPYYENQTTGSTVLAAPWLPKVEIDTLNVLTHSQTPIVFADQFFDRTAIQKGRKGNGYRDFLGLQKDTSLKDLYELVGFDRIKSVKARREVAAIVLKSGVAKFPRQAFREQALTGGFWRTKDTDDPLNNGNAVDRLFESFEFKAQEIIAVLPNGLVVTDLANDKDVQQDTAPIAIVGNHKSPNNDLEIHVGTVTCFVCHAGALAKIRDYGRAIYNEKTGVTLDAIDPTLQRRARYAYLTDDFARDYDDDNKRFDSKYKEATGLDKIKLVQAVAEQWKLYHADSVTLRRAAARAGVTPESMRVALRNHVSAKRKAGIPADAVLINFLVDDEDVQPIPIELFEERFPVLMLILKGVNP